MITQHECRSSYYGTRFVICPVCKNRAGYDFYFDTQGKKQFKCKCGKSLMEIKNDN